MCNLDQAGQMSPVEMAKESQKLRDQIPDQSSGLLPDMSAKAVQARVRGGTAMSGLPTKTTNPDDAGAEVLSGIDFS